MKISVVIRARNCATDLNRCLQALSLQRPVGPEPLEVVVVDNASEDDTARIAGLHGARVVPLSRDSFSWGRALNVGIRAASGDIIVLLSADAQAAHDEFLREMVTPFCDPRVASVYGQQLPRPDAPLEEIVRLGRYFPDAPEVFDAASPADASGRGLIVSNACAAIRRAVWEFLPYDEGIAGGEEGVWTKASLDAGYTSQYEPGARVYHSHNDPLFRSAIRGVELFLKNRELKNLSPGLPAVARWLLANARTRIRICLGPRITWFRRLEGIGKIPFEMAATLAAYVALRHAPASNLRSKLWDFQLRRN